MRLRILSAKEPRHVVDKRFMPFEESGEAGGLFQEGFARHGGEHLSITHKSLNRLWLRHHKNLESNESVVIPC